MMRECGIWRGRYKPGDGRESDKKGFVAGLQIRTLRGNRRVIINYYE